MSISIQSPNVLLCALNAKYIHSSLALRYLQAYSQADTELQINIKEFTINQPTADIMAEIYLHRPNILGFSCYLWNIKNILEICIDYKKVAPQTVIILGGPEVSYDAEQVLYDNPFIDCIIRGEGEASLKELLLSMQNDYSLCDIAGISYRNKGQIYHNPDRELIGDLDDIPFPYQKDLNKLNDRIVYYESSRGCPFRCSFCLSSNIKGVRYFSLERVKSDLKIILSQKVREIKFVDRTFNCDEKRAQQIMEFIIKYNNGVKVHLEMDAGLLSDSMLDFLATVPKDLFNLEIGIQSTYKPALDSVRRSFNWERLSHNIKRLQSYRNSHLHLDLIAGLPGESYADFTRSFNMVYNLHPDIIQLGFLKLLKGSDLRKEYHRYGYIFQSNPPYQILSNYYLTYDQVLALIRIEEILEKYYNSGDMQKTMTYIEQEIYNNNELGFFEDFADYWQLHHLFGLGHKKEALYTYLHSFIGENHPAYAQTCAELLKYDYLGHNHKYTLPEGMTSHNPANINDILYFYAGETDFIKEHMASITTSNPREIKKNLHIEYLYVDPRTFHKTSEIIPIMFIYDPISKKAETTIYLQEI